MQRNNIAQEGNGFNQQGVNMCKSPPVLQQSAETCYS